MVEFTVTVPLLVALGLGIGEFGRAIHHHHVVNKAMRDASRFLARVPVDCSAGPGTGSVTASADVTLAKNLAMNGEATGGSPRISYWTDTNSIAVTVDCTDNSGAAYRSTYGADITILPLITVTATVPYQDVGILSALGLGAITFSARHQQVHIGE